MSMCENSYYIIGSWIPTLGKVNFNKVNRGLLPKTIERKHILYEVSHKKFDCIEKITIKNKAGDKVFGSIKNITISNDGFWYGKMIMHLPEDTIEKEEWFKYLLYDIGSLVKSLCHKHLFHEEKGFAGLRVKSKKIRKDVYDNNSTLKDFKLDVLIGILDEYNKKFDFYQDAISDLTKLNYRKTFQMITQARGELLFYESFLLLFEKVLKEYMEKTDDYTILTSKFISIIADKANFLNSEKIVSKSMKLANASVVIGILGIVVGFVIALIF